MTIEKRNDTVTYKNTTGQQEEAEVVVMVDGDGDPLVAGPSQVFRLVSSAATNNAAVVKASAGKVFKGSVYNSNAAARRLKLYEAGDLFTGARVTLARKLPENLASNRTH